MIRAVVLGLLMWAVPASADPVRVRSGEHADFSRIVLLFGDVPSWSFGRVEGGYELRPVNATARYDLSKVFDLIPKTRISRIESRPGGRIFLNVDCECHGDAFEIRKGVVIDIKDGKPPRGTVFEASLPPVPDVDSQDRTEVAADTRPPLDPRLHFSFDPVRTPHAWDDQLAIEIPNSAATDVNAGQEPTVPVATDRRVAEAQASLAAQIARASAQGLVIVDAPVSPAPQSNFDPENKPTRNLEPERGVGLAPENEALAPSSNIRLETAFDQGLVTRMDDPGMTEDGAECITSDRLDVANWGIPPGDGNSFAQFRSRVIGEFDIADPDSIRALAQAHIYLTFGAEAIAVLHAYEVELPDATLLRTLAAIMDDGVARNSGPLQDQMACDTRAALWAVLARSRLFSHDTISREAVVNAFSELPLHLRRHLGPDVAQRFLSIDDTATATAIRNRIAQAPGDHGAGYQMLEADLALQTGETAAAQTHLESVANSNGPLAAEALIASIETSILSGTTVADTRIKEAEALAFEHRQTPLGSDLTRVMLSAMIHNHDYLGAADGIDDAVQAGALATSDAMTLRQTVVRGASENAGDVDFLQLVLGRALSLGDTSTADEARRLAARRLLDLGIAEVARDVLSEGEGVPTPQDRLLYAQAYLQDNRPDMAMGYLAGLSDPEALQTRALAHVSAGEHDRAAKVYATLDEPDQAANAFWRAQSWAEARASLSGMRQRAADVAANTVAANIEAHLGPDDQGGKLAVTRALLSHSRDLRGVLDGLLDEVATP